MKRLALAVLALLAGCPPTTTAPPSARTVTLYCAADREFAETVLAEFTKKTGIVVETKWDTEAAKTVGLAQALEAEKGRPRADVFWCNEPLQIALLERKGVLAELPAELRGLPAPRGERWIGFAGRARVILANTALVGSADLPRSFRDLTLPRWKGKTGIANARFGTTATHLAALVAKLGEAETRKWVEALAANEVAVCAGNGDVKNRVASGELAFGLTDTDDAWAAKSAGKPVAIIFPDPDLGALVLPNAVAVIEGAPHAREAAELAAFLVSSELELARGPGQHLPLRGKGRPDWVPELSLMAVDWSKVADAAATARELAKLLDR